MSKYQITGPDGSTYEINAPQGASESDILGYAKSQLGSQKQEASMDPKTALSAPSNGLAMGLRDAIDGGAQMLRRAVPESVAKPIDNFGAWLSSKGLPVVPSEGVAGVDNIVSGVNRKYEESRKNQQEDPGFDLSRLVGNIAQPANYLGGGSLAAANTVKQLAMAGAKAGAVSGSLQPVTDGADDFWAQKSGQAAAGAAGGAVLAPAAVKVGQSIANMAQKARPNTEVDAKLLNVQVTNLLKSEGLDRSLPSEMLDSISNQVAESLKSGIKLEPKQIIRRAQFEAVGLTDDAAPTLGQLTRDPMQWSNEKNLSGIRLSTPKGDGNPLTDRFQLQNNRLQEVFDGVGARDATDQFTAGQSILNALKESDKPIKSAVDGAYDAARDMSGGRSVELNRGVFSQSASDALDQGMWNRFLPSDVRALFNDISLGKTPFTVESAEQVDGILSSAQRKAGGGTPESSAIGVIRNALRETPFQQASVTVGGIPSDVADGIAAREAFNQARAAARNRFSTIENTPALKAALDNEAPDNFVKKYIIGAKVDDLASMKKVLQNSPEALDQARAQVANYLKGSAFGTNAAGDATFSPDRYMKTLKALGPKRLEIFFDPPEVVRLNLAGKVAADITSRPAGSAYATNSSGTGAALMNLLSNISQSPMLRQLPGARSLANQIGEIKTEKEIGKALSGQVEAQSPEVSPEVMDKIRRLLKPSGAVGGVLFGAE